MYEVFEHTADLGLRVRGADREELFVEAARGLFSILVGNLDQVRPVEKIEIQIEEDQLDYLLFDWLSELLYLFESRRTAFSRFEVELTEQGLKGTAWGEPLDRERHQIDHEIKAITYHHLKIERDSQGYLAELVVDI